MIDNFATLKDQIRQLADVVNAFKSEAVQLRIVELLVAADRGEVSREQGQPPKRQLKRSRKKSASKGPSEGGTSSERGERKASSTAGKPGSTSTLTRLITDGFFAKPKTIKEIVDHCHTKLALKFTQPNFSGPLIRAVRDGKLKRGKNKDGQFEYSKP